MPERLKPRDRSGRSALAAYVVGWVLAGVAVGGALLLAVDGEERVRPSVVALPPLQQTELRSAATGAGCVLRAGSGRGRGDPPVDGSAAAPARARYYESPPGASSLVGAMRRGIIVISYRPGLAPDERDRLRALQRAAPRGTIVAPNTAMPYAVAVTAWRRLLGCRRVGAGTLDALQLFRGRFIGSGPETLR